MFLTFDKIQVKNDKFGFCVTNAIYCSLFQ